MHGFWLGIFVGVILLLPLCYLIWLAMESAGARTWRIGAVAEELTAATLAGLGRDWKRIASVAFGELFDVDHVLIGPADVIAVETKFTTARWDTDEPDRHLRNALSQAADHARKIRLLLERSGGPNNVPAVLMVWGPGAPIIEPGWIEIDRVTLVCGDNSQGRIRHLKTQPRTLAPDEITAMADAVRGYVRAVEDDLASSGRHQSGHQR